MSEYRAVFLILILLPLFFLAGCDTDVHTLPVIVWDADVGGGALKEIPDHIMRVLYEAEQIVPVELDLIDERQGHEVVIEFVRTDQVVPARIWRFGCSALVRTYPNGELLAHELMHAMGVWGHSDIAGNLMNPPSPFEGVNLTQAQIDTALDGADMMAEGCL